jgi:hypothetical protein
MPDGDIGIFHWHNPSSRTLALALIQLLTEMGTRNISWRVQAAGAYATNLKFTGSIPDGAVEIFF